MQSKKVNNLEKEIIDSHKSIQHRKLQFREKN